MRRSKDIADAANEVELAARRAVTSETTTILHALNSKKTKVSLDDLAATKRDWRLFWAAVHRWYYRIERSRTRKEAARK